MRSDIINRIRPVPLISQFRFWRIRWEWYRLFSFRNGIGLSSTFSFISYHRDIQSITCSFLIVSNINRHPHNPVLGSESLCGNFKREKRDHSLISKGKGTSLRSAYTFTSSIRYLSLDGIPIRLWNARAKMPWGSPISEMQGQIPLSLIEQVRDRKHLFFSEIRFSKDIPTYL